MVPPGSPGVPAPAFTGPCNQVAAQPLRRLTRFEYNNTVRDLLGDKANRASGWLDEASGTGFDNDVALQEVQRDHVAQFASAAAAIAADASRLKETLPCDPAKDGEQACGYSFIDSFVSRAYRRPLDATERTSYRGLFDWTLGSLGFPDAVQNVIVAALQSPHFLYRVEVRTPGQPPRALNDHEVATRLSYFLTASLPDSALRAAADGGKLRTPAQVQEQATRLLATPAGKVALRRFYEQWFEMKHITLRGGDKDTKAYPDFTRPSMAKSLREGLELLLEDLVQSGATFADTLTADYAFANADTAKLLGVTVTGQGFSKVKTNKAERAGFLTDPGLMAGLAKKNITAPVARGAFIRENLLCTPLPPPPNGEIPEVVAKAGVSTKVLFEMHRKDPSCASCHALIDDVGLSFENYDPTGAFRTNDEAGKPIDPRGEIRALTGAETKYASPLELARYLSTNDVARSCAGSKLFQFAFGRDQTATDMCTVSQLGKTLGEGKSLRDTILSLTTSFAFGNLVQEGK
jgi:hypothetical protein